MQDPDPRSEIKALARRCADTGMDLPAARMVFTAVYVAGALVRTGNSRSKAAELAGVERSTIQHALRRGAL